MKKLGLLLAFVVFVCSSCKKEYITEATPNQTILVNLPANQWKLESDGITYSAAISVPELTQFANTNAGVLVYLSYNQGGVYEQIPEVYQGLSYSYTHNEGNVTIYAQESTGTGSITAPGAVTVKIILVDSSQ
jgi:hypothetical protein